MYRVRMKHDASRRVSGVCVALGLGLAVLTASGQEPSSRAPRNAAEFDAMFQQIKNWGRWGPNDQLGSANLVTPATRRRALALVKSGETVSLAHNPLTERADDNSNPFEHTMLPGFFMDRYSVAYHGYAHSPTPCATSCTRTRPTTATPARS